MNDLTLMSKCKSLHFDVSQTEGKELPDLAMDELTANMDGYRDFMQALSDISPVPITYEDMPGEEKGFIIRKKSGLP